MIPHQPIIDIAKANDKTNMDRDQNNNHRNKITTLVYLTFEHIDAIIEAAINLRDRLLMWLLSRTGCRVSEALDIAVENIDLALGIIVIKHLKQRIKLTCPKCNVRIGQNNKFCPGCGNKISDATKIKLEQRHRRILPVDPETLSLLNEYIQRGGPVNRNGRLLLFDINRHRVWQIITECAQKANLPRLINPDTGKIHKVGPHSFRVAFTIRWIQADDSPESLKALQEHLGHQSFTTTMRYRKMGFEERRKYYDKIKWENDNGPGA